MFKILQAGNIESDRKHASLQACGQLLRAAGFTYSEYIDRRGVQLWNEGCFDHDSFVVIDPKGVLIARSGIELALWLHRNGLAA